MTTGSDIGTDLIELAEDGAIATADVADKSLFRRVVSSPVGALCVGWVALVIFVAVFGSFIAPYDPGATNPRNAMAAPFSEGHLLGTDDAGRDVLSRLIEATQTSVIAVVLTLGIAIAIGVVSGLIAGYFGGWFDQVSNWVTNLIMAMPGIILLLAARTVLGSSILIAMAIFGIIVSPSFYRLVSSTVRAVRDELYVDAARVTGISDSRIISRHILRVVRGPIIIQASIIASVSIAVLAGLALLGFGDIESPSWGSLLSTAFNAIYINRWLLLWPAAAIALTSLSFAMLGSLLRDELEGGARSKKQSKKKEAGTATASIDLNAESTIEHSIDAPIDPLLSIRDLVVGYPGSHRGDFTEVVKGVNLDVGRGEVLGLVGESGSGKTQTAFAVMGLLGVGGRVLRGSVVFDGAELVGDESAVAASRGRRIAYIPQEPMSNLDPSFTIGSQMIEPMVVCLGLDRKAARERALELLAKVEIPEPERVLGSYPHQLSGGMAQRVLIAGAVSSEPDLIIADEPTTALDVTVQAEILDLLRDLQRDLHTSLLLVTHNFGVVADLADRVAVMQNGRIVEMGPVDSIFADARHPYTRSLMDAILDNHPVREPYAAEVRS